MFYGLAYGTALLPEKCSYCLSDIVAWVLQHLVRYRRKVIALNLGNSFPDKSVKELQQVEKGFYRNISDVLFETIRLLRLKPSTLKSRIRITNPEAIENLYATQKSVFLAIGHTGNWEWLASFLSVSIELPMIAIYKKLSDNQFDLFLKKIRQGFGRLELVESKSAYKYLASLSQPHAILILADQTPLKRDSHHWLTFLNQDTSFFMGLEKMAKRLNHAVLYLDLHRVRRGYYDITVHEICSECSQTAPYSITRQYSQHLERSIRIQPESWLWSHRRWKHKPPHDNL